MEGRRDGLVLLRLISTDLHSGSLSLFCLGRQSRLTVPLPVPVPVEEPIVPVLCEAHLCRKGCHPIVRSGRVSVSRPSFLCRLL